MSEKKALITIVDDDPSVCRALKWLVRSIGMNAETFISGRGFVDLIGSTLPTSYRRLGHRGHTIARYDRTGSAGVVSTPQQSSAGGFITAHDETGMRERALGLEAVAFLPKPLTTSY
jgi:CheY-like chemotaxis protein